MPSTKPYRAVAADSDHDAIDPDTNNTSSEFRDNDGDEVVDEQCMVIAAQSLDLELEQDHLEMEQRERSFRRSLLASACLLMAVVFGGHEYYVKYYSGDRTTTTSLANNSNGLEDSDEVDGNNYLNAAGIRGSSSSNDLDLVDEFFEEEEEEGDENDNPDGLGLDLVEGGDDDFGVEEFDGDLDDEINNGDVDEGAFDSDMDYDGEEAIEEEEEEEEEVVVVVNTEEKEEELPDYFVPLTPKEREQFKEKLRNTVRLTKNALLVQNGQVNPSPQRTLVLDSDSPKQFMHMHHMKTGGTSLDGLISCALRRQKDLHNGTSINYNKMSECGSRVKTCMGDLAKQLNASVVDNVFYRNDINGEAQVEAQFSFDPADRGLDVPIDDLNVCQTSEANVMSYCASLHAVRTFGWEGVDKVTVIRDPIDRAWSMYKFSLTRCYQCKEMKDVLRSVADGTFTRKKDETVSEHFAYDPNDSCAVQMIGHQATNLLSSLELYNVANDVRFPREQEIVNEAVRNLREEFTWIGITDRIQESIDGMRTVFPFLSENLNDAALSIENILQKSGEEVDGKMSLPEGYVDKNGCKFEHKNAGRDPTCGTKELDEETISLIKKLSNRDVAVYKAAVEIFELQQEVLEEYRSGTL